MQESDSILNVENNSFHKHLSKLSCLMIGIGGLIGGGIFSVIGVITIFTGPYSYISYLITGTIALITVYSYQKLTGKWSYPGGEYSCVKDAFKDSRLEYLSTFVGILLLFGYVSTMALYSYTFSIYFLLLIGVEYNFYLITIIIVLLFSVFVLLNLKGVKESSLIQNLLVISKVLILIFFIIFGLRFALMQSNQMIINVGLNFTSFNQFNFLGIFLGSALIIVSYQGFQLISYASYEMEDRKGGLKMMRWSLIISMIIYCLVAFTSVAILGTVGLIGDGVHDSEIAIGNAALNFLGKYGSIMIIIGVLLSTASALNATMLGSSRLAFMMALDKNLPISFSKVSKNKVPYVSIIIIGILSTTLTIITGGALSIAGVTSLLFAQIFFIINFTNFKVRKRTNSNKFWPILGMILTLTLFLILFTYNIINMASEFFSLSAFIIMECTTIFFAFHKNKMKTNNNLNKNC